MNLEPQAPRGDGRVLLVGPMKACQWEFKSPEGTGETEGYSLSYGCASRTLWVVLPHRIERM